MTASTFLAMSTGAMIGIFIACGLPLFVVLVLKQNKKKNP
jgi:hypothetical protein